MSLENFGTQLRLKRDGLVLTPQNSWKFRHGHIFMGVTFPLWALKSIDEFDLSDLQYILITAATLPEPTDIQIYFRKACVSSLDVLDEKIRSLFQELVASGFVPLSATVKLSDLGIGFIRLPLFSVEDLPDFPFEPMAEA